jgi:hypothetical protein
MSDSSPLQTVLGHLPNARKVGLNQWVDRCPVHEDHRPSLSISAGKDDKALLICRAGCETAAVVAALGLSMAELFPKTEPVAARGRSTSATYDYLDAAGYLLFQVVRFEPKGFAQRRPVGNTWVWNLQGIKPVLYRLPEILAGDPDQPVFVVEGEKDVDRLRALGFVATTNPGGAGKWRPEYSETLRGRRVVILADNDRPGCEHASAVQSALRGVAARTSIIALPGLPPKGDVSDWLDAGGTADELRQLLLGAGDGLGPTGEAGQVIGKQVQTLAEALGGIELFLRRFVVLARPEAFVAVVLWIAHTHAIEFADATPYLAISSPEKQSGKTRLLECLWLLAHDCDGIAITPTASTIFRTLEATPEATLLLDELDAVFRDHSDKYEEVRAVINAGHRRGATVRRSVPGPRNTWIVKQFPVFGPKALAGIGKLPDTVTDRSIPILMLKRKRTEPVQRFRERTVRKEAAPIAAALAEALAALPPALETDIPTELPDRAGDGWEPLLAIADAAGGVWPVRARRAAIVLHASRDQDDSLGLRLLSDVRLVFDAQGVERIFTADLIAALQADEEGPWSSEKAPFNPHRLGRLLHPFGIESKQLRIGPTSLKGYERAAFVDSWDRYLAAPPSPLEPKQRNTEHEGSFDVSDLDPSDGDGTAVLVDLPVELDYPRSAWDPNAGPDDPQAERWLVSPVRAPDAGTTP